MEQRASSLQQRLEARRNMFFKPAGAEGSSPASQSSGSAGSGSVAPSYATRAGSVTAPNSGAVPPVAAVAAAPRSLRDGFQSLGAKENGSFDRGGVRHEAEHNGSGSQGQKLPVNSTASYPTSDNKISSMKSLQGQSESGTSVKKLKQLEGYVGFANLPNQVYRKAVKKGFEFTLMVVGESGLGKSTLINSMFMTDLYSADYCGPSQRIKKTVQVETDKVLLKESGVNLTLTIVDTPGFGDAVDNSNCWDPVISYVETQYEAFLDAETRVNRLVAMPDSRVHVCLYFIAPSGHSLKPLDIEFMKKLHDKVNIVPVIAKADTMIPEEVEHFKRQVMNQIIQSKIRIYEFPDDIGCPINGKLTPEEEKEKKENKKLKERVPFAVVGSNTLIDASDESGRKIRGRKYPWGVVDIENMEHCDFVALRNMLIRSHLQDLKEVTNNVLYENFRCRKLAGVAGGTMEKIPNRNPLAQIEEERREHQAKMSKMEREMEEVFERKVREKKQKLSDSQQDLEKRHRESREKLEQQKRELETKSSAFEKEKTAWEHINNITIDELKRLSMESLDGVKKKKATMTSRVKLAFT